MKRALCLVLAALLLASMAAAALPYRSAVKIQPIVPLQPVEPEKEDEPLKPVIGVAPVTPAQVFPDIVCLGPAHTPDIPELPYDADELGDCGITAENMREINAFIAGLGEVAGKCMNLAKEEAARFGSWKNALLNEVEKLPTKSGTLPPAQEAGVLSILPSLEPSEPLEPSDTTEYPPWTGYLYSMRSAVEKTCERVHAIDDVMEGLQDTCRRVERVKGGEAFNALDRKEMLSRLQGLKLPYNYPGQLQVTYDNFHYVKNNWDKLFSLEKARQSCEGGGESWGSGKAGGYTETMGNSGRSGIRDVEYDKLGRVIGYEYVDNDGAIHKVENIVYDEQGRVVGYTETTRGSGSPDRVTRTERSNTQYDRLGRVTSYTEKTFDADAPEKATTTVHHLEYDALGRVVSETVVDSKTGKTIDASKLRDALGGLTGGGGEAGSADSFFDVFVDLPGGGLAAGAVPVLPGMGKGPETGRRPGVRGSPGLDSVLAARGLLSVIPGGGRLVCPERFEYEIDWPPEPYELHPDNDCEMVGREEEIEAYIAALQEIVDECVALTDERIAEWHAQHDDVVSQMESFPVDEESPYVLAPALPLFGLSEPLEPGDSGPLRPLDDDHSRYTETYLLNMKEAVEKTCQRMSELNKRLVNTCGEVRDYIGDDTSLLEETRDDLVRVLESISINEDLYRNSVQMTADWFDLLENNYHNYYNPDYVFGPECPREGQGRLGPVSESRRSDAPLVLNRGLLRPGRIAPVGNGLRGLEAIPAGFRPANREEFQLYAAQVLEASDAIEQLEVSEDAVTVDVKETAQLFGFIPIDYTLRLHSDGKKVSAEKPFWLLFATHRADILADFLAGKVRAEHEKEGGGGDGGAGAEQEGGSGEAGEAGEDNGTGEEGKRVTREGLDEVIEDVEEQQEEARDKREQASTAFQNFDQKTNQLYNMLASVLKTMNEMRGTGSGSRSGL